MHSTLKLNGNRLKLNGNRLDYLVLKKENCKTVQNILRNLQVEEHPENRSWPPISFRLSYKIYLILFTIFLRTLLGIIKQAQITNIRN